MGRKTWVKAFWIVGIITVIGAVLRLACCYWGYPYQLHPDEGTVVNNAIDIIARHTFEPNVYNRPDHFEIKCNAVLFTIISHLKYGCSAAEAFAEHRTAFYLIARGFTVIWGTLMIPLAYLICEKVRKRSGIWAALLVTFFPIFIKNSAYATPDIPLTFFFMLIIYTLMLYIEKPTIHRLLIICLEIAISITIKYTAAISCIPVALIIIANAVREKNYWNIGKLGIVCVLSVFIMCFFMAPNLFTNMSMTLNTLKTEARNTHLGADNLGFIGNMLFYVKTFLYSGGFVMLVFSVIGGYDILKKKIYLDFPIFSGIVFWICTSVLALHWDRWGMPIYIMPVLLAAVGIEGVIVWIHNQSKKLSGKFIRAVGAVCCILGLTMGANLLFGTANLLTTQLAKQAQVEGIEFCRAKGITTENSIYEGYSPLCLAGPVSLEISISETGDLIFQGNKKNAKYIVLSSNMYDRYYAEADRYAKEVAVHDKIADSYTLIYENQTLKERKSMSGLWNIVCNIKNIVDKSNGINCGYTILIYKI